MKRFLVAILITLGAALPAGAADITGHHTTLLDSAAMLPNTTQYGGTWTVERVYYGADSWLSKRANSYFIYTNGGLWRAASPWRDLNASEAEGGPLGYWPDQWDIWADPCEVPGDETWMFVYDPAHLDTPFTEITEGWNVPSWHTMRRISPCVSEPDGLTAYSPSQPFVDGPTGDRLFLILDQSDAARFPRYRIQYVENRDQNARWFGRNDADWATLFELDRSMWNSHQLLHVVCPNDGSRIMDGSGNVLSITWQCLFNFNQSGVAKVGNMRLEFDSRRADPYRVWVARNSATDWALLPVVNGKRTLQFTPYGLTNFNGYIVQQIYDKASGGQEVWMVHKPGTNVGQKPCDTTVYQAHAGGNSDAGVYVADYWRSANVPQHGTIQLATKTAVGNPPDSTYLSTFVNSHLLRFSVSVAGPPSAPNLFSNSKWDPHLGGLPYICSRLFHGLIFEGMSLIREPMASR